MLRTLLKFWRLTGYSMMSWWLVATSGAIVTSSSVGGNSDASAKSMSSRLWKLSLALSWNTDIFMVWGEEVSGGARMMTDLSLLCPLKQKKVSHSCSRDVRDEDDDLFVCIAFKNLKSEGILVHTFSVSNR